MYCRHFTEQESDGNKDQDRHRDSNRVCMVRAGEGQKRTRKTRRHGRRRRLGQERTGGRRPGPERGGGGGGGGGEGGGGRSRCDFEDEDNETQEHEASAEHGDCGYGEHPGDVEIHEVCLCYC